MQEAVVTMPALSDPPFFCGAPHRIHAPLTCVPAQTMGFAKGQLHELAKRPPLTSCLLPSVRMQGISRIVGDWWTNLPASEKEPFAKLAKEDKER